MKKHAELYSDHGFTTITSMGSIKQLTTPSSAEVSLTECTSCT